MVTSVNGGTGVLDASVCQEKCAHDPAAVTSRRGGGPSPKQMKDPTQLDTLCQASPQSLFLEKAPYIGPGTAVEPRRST